MGTGEGITIYFVRHAKDDGRFRGGWSTKPLVYDGRLQANRLADELTVRTKEMNIGTIISSDLVRAVQTAVPTAKRLGLEIEQSPLWRETNNGRLAGMHNAEAKRLYPGLFWSTLDMDEHYPDGESPKEFYCRIKEAFEALCENIRSGKINSNVLIFTHSGVINVVYSLVKNKEWTNKGRQFDIPFTSVHAFDMTENTIKRFL